MILLIVVTVDLETPQTPLRKGLFNSDLLDPMANGQRLGYSLILRIFSRFKLRGVFFVNVYESAVWGDEPLRVACQDIVGTGHEVALHTHPAWSFDRGRPHMWQYSLREQTQIVADGLDMLERWLPSYKVVTHRAGAYGINLDTLHALRSNGILVDSSMIYGHRNCKQTWSCNQVVARDGILEIPVTGFLRDKVFYAMGIPVRRRRSFVKTDIDAASLDELKFFVEEAKRHDIRVMNLFMHSYSFVRFDADFTHFEPDYEDIEKFEWFLEEATTDPSIRFATMRELFEIYRKGPGSLLDGLDYLPIRRYQVNLVDKIKRKFLSEGR